MSKFIVTITNKQTQEVVVDANTATEAEQIACATVLGTNSEI